MPFGLELSLASAVLLQAGATQSAGDFPDGVSAVHWRVRTNKNNGDSTYTNLSEIVWLDAAGNPISTAGATFSGTALQAGSYAELYDGNPATFAQVASSTVSYFATQFPSAVQVGGVKLTPYSTFTARAPLECDIEWSTVGGSNDADWTLFMSVTQPNWAASTQQTFMRPALTTHTHWRNRATALGGGGTLAMSEMQFREVRGVAQNPSGGSPIFRSQQAGAPASNLYDNSTATIYAENNLSFLIRVSYVGYAFATPVDIKQVVMTARADGFPDQAPTAGVIQSGSDGIRWRPRKIYSGLSFTNGSSATVDV